MDENGNPRKKKEEEKRKRKKVASRKKSVGAEKEPKRVAEREPEGDHRCASKMIFPGGAWAKLRGCSVRKVEVAAGLLASSAL